MRRRDIALFTGGQGAVLAIIGKELPNLGPDGWTLSAVAFLIALVGFNNERRLYRYLDGFRARAEELESDYGMALLKTARDSVRELKMTVSSTKAFQGYYLIIAIGWILVWIVNA